MDVIGEWTGRKACALQRALRLTNDGFANRLGAAVRTIANWHAEPDLIQIPEWQMALDTLLSNTSEDVKARFAMLITVEQIPGSGLAPELADSPQLPIPVEVENRIAEDRHIGAAFDWLDRSAGWVPGTSRQRVARRLTGTDPREIQDRGHRRGRVGQHAIASALSDYYSGLPDDFGFFRAHNDIGGIVTSILTRPRWLDLRLPLGGGDNLRFVQPVSWTGGRFDSEGADAAIQRLAETLATKTLLINAPLYRLLKISIEGGDVVGTMTLMDFVGYALTVDLLENELIDNLVDGVAIRRGNLPLRDRYLPDIATALDFQRRICVGGPLALCAIARAAGRMRRAPDYLLLIQERSGRVLNAARRLAVIPKCFHEPLVDYSDDVHLAASLEREMEEELFGRTDVDSTYGDQRQADPMHVTRLSPPMRWLVDRANGDDWRMECTGFGLNLVSGNFEFASLIVIDNENWWEQFGGHIEANWESNNLRRYSSLDHELLTTLAHDPAWSNEGLFALIQGLRRLAEIGGGRVNVPSIEWEV